jgi:geranylgeranyl pyrophosphate synthase
VTATILLSRAAQSWRYEGPGGFGKRTMKYFMRLGRPAIGEPIGAYARMPAAPRIETLGALEEAHPADSLYGPVQRDLPLVDELLKTLRPADFPFLSNILDHVLAGGGKRARPAVTLLAGRLGRYDLDLLVPLAASIELLHSATLVHDDVIDAAPTRRGRETANALIDNAASVMVGDYMFAHSAELVARTGNNEVIRLFARTLMEMATGELNQDMTAYQYGQSTLQYFNRIYGKTASLFATSAQGGGMVAGLTQEQTLALRAYGENLGMAFQVVDDVLDFSSSEEELGKPAASDLMQGTLTLPALLLIERYPDDNPVERYFDDRDDAESLQRALEMIRGSDILDESLNVAFDFRDKALQALESPSLRSLDSHAASQALATMAQVARWVTERRA